MPPRPPPGGEVPACPHVCLSRTPRWCPARDLGGTEGGEAVTSAMRISGFVVWRSGYPEEMRSSKAVRRRSLGPTRLRPWSPGHRCQNDRPQGLVAQGCHSGLWRPGRSLSMVVRLRGSERSPWPGARQLRRSSRAGHVVVRSGQTSKGPRCRSKALRADQFVARPRAGKRAVSPPISAANPLRNPPNTDVLQQARAGAGPSRPVTGRRRRAHAISAKR